MPESVVEELLFLKDRYGINSFFFHDDTMTANKKWLFKLCDLLDTSNANIIWGCNSTVDTFIPEVAERMKETGLKKIHFGIESGSQRVLDDIYKKGITIEQTVHAIETAKKYGIYTLGFFMLGAPTETEEEMKKTIQLIKHLDLKEVVFSNILFLTISNINP